MMVMTTTTMIMMMSLDACVIKHLMILRTFHIKFGTVLDSIVIRDENRSDKPIRTYS